MIKKNETFEQNITLFEGFKNEELLYMSSNDIVYMNWRQMIKPNKIVVEGSEFYGRFVCEPLEIGYGVTIGNSLRRILLSSLYGAAVVSVRFDEILHEFSTITGVLEDISEIILNIKNLKVKIDSPEPKKLTLNVKGKNALAKNIVSPDGGIEIMNPDLHIATLSKGAVLNMEMTVKFGKGYSLAADNKDEDDPVGTLLIDSIFSPIKKVKYGVSTARVGQKTDYDKLTFEVWTDGSIKPEDAVAFSAKILKEQLNPFINFEEEPEPEPEPEPKEDKKQVNENLYRKVDELELSVRSANCLKNAEIETISQLVKRTEKEMLNTKNFGRKSLNEIKDILVTMDLRLGMPLDDFENQE